MKPLNQEREAFLKHFVPTLHEGAQRNILEAMERGESHTFDAWMARASLPPTEPTDPRAHLVSVGYEVYGAERINGTTGPWWWTLCNDWTAGNIISGRLTFATETLAWQAAMAHYLRHSQFDPDADDSADD